MVVPLPVEVALQDVRIGVTRAKAATTALARQPSQLTDLPFMLRL